jgi:hypothetical protein
MKKPMLHQTKILDLKNHLRGAAEEKATRQSIRTNVADIFQWKFMELNGANGKNLLLLSTEEGRSRTAGTYSPARDNYGAAIGH